MPTQPHDQFLELPEGDPLSSDQLHERVQQAEQEEQQLKRKWETAEKQRRELDELSRRQDVINSAKAELTDKLTRALVVVEREMLDASKRLEMLQGINSSFTNHLDAVEAIDTRFVEGLDMNKELTRSHAALDDARAEYTRSYPKVCVIPEQDAGSVAADAGYGGDYSGGDAKDFLTWVKMGVAFSLPLIVFGLIALVVILSRLPAK